MADETAADEVRLARSQPTTRPIPTCTPAERRLGALQRRAEQPRTPSCGGARTPQVATLPEALLLWAESGGGKFRYPKVPW